MRKSKLPAKQQMFIKEYLIDLNATQAAIRAGYSKKTAGQIGDEILKKPEIARAIQKAMDERSKRTEITADAVLQELAKLGFSNIKNVYDEETGELSHVCALDDNVTAAITEVRETTRRDKDGNTTSEKTYKIADKKTALELLGKHLKLFTDRAEITGANGVPLVPDTIKIIYE